MTKSQLTLSPRLLFLTWGGAGLMRPASGTWGSLFAIPFILPVLWLYGPVGCLVLAAVLYVISIPVILRHEKVTGTHDDSCIVIDEVIGMCLALAPAALAFIDVVVAFLLFRLFDAIKPGVIGRLDKTVPGAHGVLLDDVLAGALAGAGVLLLHAIVWAF